MDEPCDTSLDQGAIPEVDLLALGTAPLSTTVDGRTNTERSVGELIALDKHLAAKKAKCVSGWGALGVARAIPPDAAGVQ